MFLILNIENMFPIFNFKENSMCKKFYQGLTLLLLLLLPFGLAAQEDEASVDLNFNVVSGYVFRGDDLTGVPFAAQEEMLPESASISTPTFQPDITFNTPLTGLYFNIWLSWALTGRDDVDLDKDGEAEENGLKRFDEVDYTIGYESESRVGTVGFGIVSYIYSGTANKDATLNEIFFTYSPPGPVWLSNLGFAAYSTMNGGAGDETDYYQLAYGFDIELTYDLSLYLEANAAYQVEQSKDGLHDYGFVVAADFAGFSLALNAAFRHDLEFFDHSDYFTYVEDANGETDYDKVIDPDSATGEEGDIPSLVWWISLGYSLSL